MSVFSTPHYNKLLACLENPRLPASDQEYLQEALKQYAGWIDSMNAVLPGEEHAVEKLVAAANRYKRFIEVDLIFDSPGIFYTDSAAS